MTNTLEQRAVSEALDSLREALPPRPRPGVHETVAIGSTHLLTIHAALAELEAALRLSAGADLVLAPRVLTDEMCQAGHKAQWDAKPDGILGGEVTISLNAIYRAIFAAQIAAAPRHEPGEGS